MTKTLAAWAATTGGTGMSTRPDRCNECDNDAITAAGRDALTEYRVAASAGKLPQERLKADHKVAGRPPEHDLGLSRQRELPRRGVGGRTPVSLESWAEARTP